jgi:aconitate hydratase
MGGDPAKINPSVPVELVIDHSVQADVFGRRDAFRRTRSEISSATRTLFVPALGAGSIRRLHSRAARHRDRAPGQPPVPARAVFVDEARGGAYPDTLVGTDSHTTMVNGLGVDADPAGDRLPAVWRAAAGRDRDRSRADGGRASAPQGRRGNFVEYSGAGLARLPLADRATIGACRRSSPRPARSSRSTRRHGATSICCSTRCPRPVP